MHFFYMHLTACLLQGNRNSRLKEQLSSAICRLFLNIQLFHSSKLL